MPPAPHCFHQTSHTYRGIIEPIYFFENIQSLNFARFEGLLILIS